MSKGSRVLASLLAVVAVLLAANLLVTWTPSASAQARPMATIKGHSFSSWYIAREWSDGRVEVRTIIGSENGPVFGPWKIMPQN